MARVTPVPSKFGRAKSLCSRRRRLSLVTMTSAAVLRRQCSRPPSFKTRLRCMRVQIQRALSFDRSLALRKGHKRIRRSQSLTAFHMLKSHACLLMDTFTQQCVQPRTAQAVTTQLIHFCSGASGSSSSLTAAGCSMLFPLWVGWPGRRDPSAIAISPGTHSSISRNTGPTCFRAKS